MDRISLSLRPALLKSVGEEDKTALPEQPQAAGEKLMGYHQFKAQAGLRTGIFTAHSSGPLFY